MRKYLWQLVILIITAGVAFGIGYRYSPEESYALLERREKRDSSSLTNPLLECAELPPSITIGARLDLEEDLENLIAQSMREGAIANAALYFRDLNNGPWFGIEEDKEFYPASLLKLPLAMSVMKLNQNDPRLLETEIEYGGSGGMNVEASQPYQPTSTLQEGFVYTVEDLVGVMLRESSNEAALVLSELIGIEVIQDIYKDFGQTFPREGEELPIDVHTYASFFRILYNATYLDQKSSEFLLTLLTNTTFKEGVIAGVPLNVPVAHKYGTRELANGTKQLHDCGIVYAENTPYILCVMTQGTDYSKQARFIQEVSERVYRNVAQ